MTEQADFLSWDLDSLFEGGSQSPALQATLHHIQHQIQHFQRKFKQLSDIKKGILYFQELEGHCHDLQEFVNCLLAQNVKDQEAMKLNSQTTSLRASCDLLSQELDLLLSELDRGTFMTLLVDPDLQGIIFHLQERRQQTKAQLPIEQERLIRQLAVSGYQGWEEIYQLLLGQLHINSPLPAEEALSIGQASNRLTHPTRSIRQGWFKQWEAIWTSHEDVFAHILNHLGGFRMEVYKARGWNSPLHGPLLYNRMQENTLQTMWGVVDKCKNCLYPYLARKAELLNLEKLSWYDIEAPLPFASESSISFNQAVDLITESFTIFSPPMGAFAQKAFKQRWIEAEDRLDKRPGAFCAAFLHKEQSRIFMTYSGSMANVLTLAHEFGHAYHNEEMKGLPIFARQYRLSVAETASTLAENIVIEALLRKHQDQDTHLALLDYKLQRTVLFLMDIQARFLFELDFYHTRRKGLVLAKDLNALMENAQKQAFGDALSEWHPHLWAAKPHFYDTGIPFYNFPYAFGYLFSQGLYAHFKQHEEDRKAYASLLRDTGCLTVEELAYKHLKVKLEDTVFWEHAFQLIQADVVSYLELSSKSS